MDYQISTITTFFSLEYFDIELKAFKNLPPTVPEQKREFALETLDTVFKNLHPISQEARSNWRNAILQPICIPSN